MDRGVRLVLYTPWGPTESDTTEVTEHACMKLRADPTAKEFGINTEEAGGLEQRETEKHVPEPENKARENATEQTGRVIGSAGSRGDFSHLRMSAEALRWGGTEAHNLFAPRCAHKTLRLSPARPPRAGGKQCDHPLSLAAAVSQVYPAPAKQHRAFPGTWRDVHGRAWPS